MSFVRITIVNGAEFDSKAGIILNQGLNFGRGVFETIAVAGRCPIFLEKHINRMKRGLTALGIDNSVSEEDIIRYIHKFDIRDCAMKVLVTPENIVVSTRENIYVTKRYEEGSCVTVSTLQRNPHSHVVYHKTINYLDNMIENELAHKAGFDEVIFTNVYNQLAEGSVSNLFFVSGGRIFTPGIGCGILDGIVRSWVLDNFDAEEGKYTLEQLMQADEVFLTNSLMGIMPVKQIQDMAFGCPGKVCEAIKKAYCEAVRSEVEKFAK